MRPTTKNAQRSKFGLASAAFGAILWILSPVVAIGTITYFNQRATFVTEESAWIPVEPTDDQLERPVDLALSWSVPGEIVAPEWSGVVQQLYVGVGAAVSSGTHLLKVNGVDRVAWATPGPFYRPLSNGDRGEDVAWLKSILARGSIEQTATDRFDAAALRGVRDLAASLGISDSRSVAGFDPSWIVYIPREDVTVIELHTAVAQPAVPPGAAVATLRPTLQGAGIVMPGTLPGGVSDGTTHLGLADLDSLLESSGLTATEGESLESSGVSLALDDSLSRLTEASLTSLDAELPPGSQRVSGALKSTAQADTWRVPAAALSNDLDGHFTLCVQRADGTLRIDATVLPLVSELTLVTADLRPDDLVRVPAESRTMPCQSS